ncbi:hypothetical protein IFR05_000672 [Cadophora sp. M221]|nr:hypothetical protein IFR05_000672 [Cadophora sp. M221]
MTPPSHDVNFPTHTFEGDILDTAEAVTTVIGTTLVFNAESSDGVMDMLAGDPRSTQGIWDISTAVISPFETVLTSDLGKLIEAQSEIRESRILDPRMLRSSLFTSLSVTRAVPAARCFSTLPATKREWLLIIPDKPEVLETRIKIRPVHSVNFRQLQSEGHVSWGGPRFEKHVEGGERRPFCGSVLVMNGGSKEEVLEKINDDVYVQQKVWDLENAQIYPFVTRSRKDHEES